MGSGGFVARSANVGPGVVEPRHFSSKGRRYSFEEFRTVPFTAKNNQAEPTGATGDINRMLFLASGLEVWQFILGAGQTIIVPTLDDTGLNVALDQTDNEGAEYAFGGDPAANRGKHHYEVGTNAGALNKSFYARLKWSIEDASGTDEMMFGLRKVQAPQTAHTSYTDYAAVGLFTAANPGAIQIKTRLNTGTAALTNTTKTWADNEAHTVELRVNPTGVVTFLLDGVFPAVNVNGFTFDDGDIVVPFFYFLHAPDLAGKVVWQEFEAGFRSERAA